MAALGAWCVLAAGGCSKDSNPLSSVIEPLFPPSPGQVARQAISPGTDPDARRRALTLLANSPFGGVETYVKVYRLFTDHEDATVRAAAIKALAMHGQVEDTSYFVHRLEDSTSIVRWESAKALQRIHNPSPAVISALSTRLSGKYRVGDSIGEFIEEDADVRSAAAYALGQYAEPGVFNTLVAALNDPDFAVVHAARQSLHTLTGYDFGNDGSLWLIWAKRHEGHIFEHQQQYVWQPYVKPRTILDKAQFWKKYKEPQPQPPVGLGGRDRGNEVAAHQ